MRATTDKPPEQHGSGYAAQRSAQEQQPPINPKYSATSAAVSDGEDSAEEFDTSAGAKPSSRTATSAKAAAHYQVALTSGTGEENVFAAFSQPHKEEDDSKLAFVDRIAATFGSRDYAPSAPPATEEDLLEYAAWLRATRLVERQQFHRHQQFNAHLHATGSADEFNPVLGLSELPLDRISAEFKARAKAFLDAQDGRHNPALESFLNGTPVPNGFDRFEKYQAKHHSPDKPLDEVLHLLGQTDEVEHAASYNPRKHVIPAGKIWIISDHGGAQTGRKFQIWGPGNRKPFVNGRSQSLGIVEGITAEGVPLNTDYFHIAGRFTILRVQPNELGFCYDLMKQKILVLDPGRYFLAEHEVNYIGKAQIKLGQMSFVLAHKNDEFLRGQAARLQLVQVQPNQVAFVAGNEGSFVLESRQEPYILDVQQNQVFLNMEDRNANPCMARDETYALVQLREGEFICFSDNQRSSFVWQFDPEKPELNTVHLSRTYFRFEGRVHSVREAKVAFENLVVVNNLPNHFTCLRDPEQNLRFIEASTAQPLVLRAPWGHVATGRQMEELFTAEIANGAKAVRVVNNVNHWVAVVTKEGQLQFFPPLLTGQPYYFYEPDFRLVKTIDRSLDGVQSFTVDGIGDVSVVNLSTGKLGACRIRNVNGLLNPRVTEPYIFVAPDCYLGTLDNKQPHFTVGDLHRIYLQPDERAVVVRDGKAILLPQEADALAAENQGDGIYIFRARQNLEIFGPEKKTKKQYRLGPYHFFTVDAGEVAYGSRNGKLHIWREQGEHSINVSRNERFAGFFETKVEPLKIENIPVTWKHSITSHLGIYVTFTIDDPEKTITIVGGDHAKIHEFVSNIARAAILDVCSRKPPVGFSDADFDAKERSSIDDAEKTDVGKMKETFLQMLASNPQLQRAGIQIGFAQITDLRIDPEFVESSRAIALSLQQAHSQIEQRNIELQQTELLIRQRQQEAELARIKREQETLDAVAQAERTAKTQGATSIAAAEVRAAQAKAEVAAQLATRQGEIDAELAQARAETEKAAEGRKRAEIEAGARVAALTVERTADSEATVRLAEAAARARQVEAASLVDLAQAQQKQAEAQAAAEQAKVRAQFGGITDPAVVAQLLLAKLAADTQREVAKSLASSVVVHTTNPEQAARVFSENIGRVLSIGPLLMQMTGASPAAPGATPLLSMMENSTFAALAAQSSGAGVAPAPAPAPRAPQ